MREPIQERRGGWADGRIFLNGGSFLYWVRVLVEECLLLDPEVGKETVGEVEVLGAEGLVGGEVIF